MWFHISCIFAPKASLRDFWIVLVGLVGPNSYGGGVDPSGTFHRLGWQAWNGKIPNLVHCVRALGIFGSWIWIWNLPSFFYWILIQSIHTVSKNGSDPVLTVLKDNNDFWTILTHNFHSIYFVSK